MKTAYYCFGGGLGHLTRFIAWCHTTGTQPLLLTNCSAAGMPGLLPAGVRCQQPSEADQQNKDTLRSWLSRVITAENPQQLVIDAFPGGILGELAGLPELTGLDCLYLARILKVDAYLPRLAGAVLPKFAQIYRVEKLHEEHESWLHELSDHITGLPLRDPPPPAMTAAMLAGLPQDFELIVHSGNESELRQLYHLLHETWLIEGTSGSVVVVSPGPRPAFLADDDFHLDCYPAGAVIERARRVFSAAGCNIMRQMAAQKKPHQVLPLPRALDDQFFRAACQIKNSRDHAMSQ